MDNHKDIKTWRERIGAGADFPLHSATDVERAMEAEIAELRAARAAVGAAEPVKLPSTPDEMIAFIGNQCEVREDGEDPSRVRFQLTVHDLMSAFDWWFGDATPTILAAPSQAAAEVRAALQTISEFPVTDPGNMDAWNMREIAIVALKGAEAPATAGQSQQSRFPRDLLPHAQHSDDLRLKLADRAQQSARRETGGDHAAQ